MFVDVPDESAVSDEVSSWYERQRASWGYLPNYARAFATRPDVAEAWTALSNAVGKGMDRRRYELATIAAARELRSTYCTAAHTLVLAQKWPEPARDDVDLAVIALAEMVARDAASVEQADVDRLRDLGLTDAEVFDVVAAAALRSFFAKTLDGLGAEPDAEFAQRLDSQQRAGVTVGRPFASVGE